jgi:glucosamine-6-phosphate deaminase
MIFSIGAISNCFHVSPKHRRIPRAGDIVQLRVTESPAEFAEVAAHNVVELLEKNPAAAIALPTGNTPLGLYQRLADLRRESRFSCPRARFFNLDEFAGKSAQDPQSYAAFLKRHFFLPLGISPGQTRLLRGDARDVQAECRDFDREIVEAGGIDLAILGLGANGHIAFNEPGSDWNSETREIALTAETRRSQLGLFASETEVPTHGLTMGVKTIRAARRILLLVSGAAKADALAALLRGRPDLNWPVTALVEHPDLAVLADRKPAEAAGAGR